MSIVIFTLCNAYATVSALECAASTTELAPPVPLTRVAGSRHLDEPIYDTVPAEDNVDTDPVCDVCGGGMDPDHAVRCCKWPGWQ